MKKLLIILSCITLFLLLFFADNIYGYYRFKQFCKNEGGLRVYGKLEKNVGWMAEDKYSARSAAQLKYVDFVRYPDKRKKDTFYDMQYLGGHPGDNDSYLINQADIDKPIKYKWKFTSGRLDDEIRLTRQMDEVFDIDGNLLISYKKYSYSIFDIGRTLLHSPSGIGCYNLSESIKLIKNLF
ncbi:hypothetical protein AB835_00745 [Candidatus Endobugula sertula]|uniref:Uncharacterized protein n=1 Tax=Candidatus Endobugula sertula TaxID=62101 RepID=A0A1D2QU12_9GAMM|nr:hypothetical protein AB835_00745 [Candidatus Endobugula sertula]